MRHIRYFSSWLWLYKMNELHLHPLLAELTLARNLMHVTSAGRLTVRGMLHPLVGVSFF